MAADEDERQRHRLASKPSSSPPSHSHTPQYKGKDKSEGVMEKVGRFLDEPAEKTGDNRYTCCGRDHEGFFTQIFCTWARFCEHPLGTGTPSSGDECTSKDCALVMFCCWFCSCFASTTLGEESDEICRSMSMTCYPCWVGCWSGCLFVETIFRILIYLLILAIAIPLALLVSPIIGVFILCFLVLHIYSRNYEAKEKKTDTLY